MSSVAVRTLFKNFLAANSAETVVDLTGEFGDLRTILPDYDVQPDSPWLGIEFIGGVENPVSLVADNTRGLYREVGMVQLHVVAVARLGAGNSILTRGEVLRNLFRGLRIDGIIIEAVNPINTGPGATLEFEAGFVSGTISVEYHYDFTPGT